MEHSTPNTVDMLSNSSSSCKLQHKITQETPYINVNEYQSMCKRHRQLRPCLTWAMARVKKKVQKTLELEWEMRQISPVLKWENDTDTWKIRFVGLYNYFALVTDIFLVSHRQRGFGVWGDTSAFYRERKFYVKDRRRVRLWDFALPVLLMKINLDINCI